MCGTLVTWCACRQALVERNPADEAGALRAARLGRRYGLAGAARGAARAAAAAAAQAGRSAEALSLFLRAGDAAAGAPASPSACCMLIRPSHYG